MSGKRARERRRAIAAAQVGMTADAARIVMSMGAGAPEEGEEELASLAFPSVKRGSGSGSDDRGDYNYEYVTLRFVRCTLEVGWWPE